MSFNYRTNHAKKTVLTRILDPKQNAFFLEIPINQYLHKYAHNFFVELFARDKAESKNINIEYCLEDAMLYIFISVDALKNGLKETVEKEIDDVLKQLNEYGLLCRFRQSPVFKERLSYAFYSLKKQLISLEYKHYQLPIEDKKKEKQNAILESEDKFQYKFLHDILSKIVIKESEKKEPSYTKALLEDLNNYANVLKDEIEAVWGKSFDYLDVFARAQLEETVEYSSLIDIGEKIIKQEEEREVNEKCYVEEQRFSKLDNEFLAIMNIGRNIWNKYFQTHVENSQESPVDFNGIASTLRAFVNNIDSKFSNMSLKNKLTQYAEFLDDQEIPPFIRILLIDEIANDSNLSKDIKLSIIIFFNIGINFNKWQSNQKLGFLPRLVDRLCIFYYGGSKDEDFLIIKGSLKKMGFPKPKFLENYKEHFSSLLKASQSEVPGLITFDNK